MRIESGQINLFSSHEKEVHAEVKVSTHIHNRVETHTGEVRESEFSYNRSEIDLARLREAGVNTHDLDAQAVQGIRLKGQGITISTRDSLSAGRDGARAEGGEGSDNGQVSDRVSRHYSRMNVSAIEAENISVNRSTGSAMIKDLHAEFLVKIMEMSLGQSLREMSPEELAGLGLNEENIMRIRGFFNEQDDRRAQYQADLNKMKGRYDAEPQRSVSAPQSESIASQSVSPSRNTTPSSNISSPSDTDQASAGPELGMIAWGNGNGNSDDTAITGDSGSTGESDATDTSGNGGSGGNGSTMDNPPEVSAGGASTGTVSPDNSGVASSDEGSDTPSDNGAIADTAPDADTATAQPSQSVQENGENGQDEEPIPPGMVRRTTTISTSRESIFREEEHTRFSAQGKVLTSDGKEIDLELDIGMSRMFESTEMAHSIKVLKDPLVVNFDGPAVALDGQKTFMFDIDMDGEEDQLAQLKSGSGFLALDKNGDGVINDGSELFGAQSGNGFADLAEYDEDGDGFIDEDDSVFNKLRIWVPGDDGESELFALLDKDVGAIHLNHVSTEFALNRASDNENLGYVRSSGVFLKESGGVGSIQQIDLAV